MHFNLFASDTRGCPCVFGPTAVLAAKNKNKHHSVTHLCQHHMFFLEHHLFCIHDVNISECDIMDYVLRSHEGKRQNEICSTVFIRPSLTITYGALWTGGWRFSTFNIHFQGSAFEELECIDKIFSVTCKLDHFVISSDLKWELMAMVILVIANGSSEDLVMLRHSLVLFFGPFTLNIVHWTMWGASYLGVSARQIKSQNSIWIQAFVILAFAWVESWFDDSRRARLTSLIQHDFPFLVAMWCTLIFVLRHRQPFRRQPFRRQQ